MKWRIRIHACQDGTEKFYPEYKVFILWHRMHLMEWLRNIWNKYEESHDIKHDFELNDAWDGYVYLFSADDALKTIELYERSRRKMSTLICPQNLPKDTFVYLFKNTLRRIE